MNLAIHSETRMSPFFLFLGREPRIPLGGGEGDTQVDTEESFLQLSRYMERVAERFDDVTADQRFQVGDRVLVQRPTVKPGEPRKFMTEWKGPWSVIGRRGWVHYVVSEGNGQTRLMHASQLKKWRPSTNLVEDSETAEKLPLRQNSFHSLRPRVFRPTRFI